MNRNQNRKSFGFKLWLSFLCYAAIIFAALWLLQIVFLQNFYDGMAIHRVKRVAAQIAEQEDSDSLTDAMDRFASEHSLLIFLTDWQGNVLYSADEHNSVYQRRQNWDNTSWERGDEERREVGVGNPPEAGTENFPEVGVGNPPEIPDEPMGWGVGPFVGPFRYLPPNYGEFLEKLADSETGSVGYSTERHAAYIYGMALPPSEQFGSEGAVLFISMQLGAVGAATGILSMQLIWVTLISLALGAVIARFLSRQFARPIFAISAQAKRMASGEFGGSYEKGFCLELDELSDTLTETATALGRLENARRELLANVSHDLRTPLTMIKGYAEVVRDISWDDDRKREEDLAVIIREADRLTGLVNDLLEYSSVESQNLSEDSLDNSREMDLSAAVQYVVEQFAPLCEQKNYELKTSIMPGQWVNGDEDLLKRVLYNLIDNAIVHSGSNRIVQVTLTGAAETVRVEVRDFGTGISKERQPYIWDRYFTSKRRGGDRNKSGLGLAIAKEILLKQGADFGVESDLGQGCLFWFELKKCTQA